MSHAPFRGRIRRLAPRVARGAFAPVGPVVAGVLLAVVTPEEGAQTRDQGGAHRAEDGARRAHRGAEGGQRPADARGRIDDGLQAAALLLERRGDAVQARRDLGELLHRRVEARAGLVDEGAHALERLEGLIEDWNDRADEDADEYGGEYDGDETGGVTHARSPVASIYQKRRPCGRDQTSVRGRSGRSGAGAPGAMIECL